MSEHSVRSYDFVHESSAYGVVCSFANVLSIIYALCTMQACPVRKLMRALGMHTEVSESRYHYMHITLSSTCTSGTVHSICTECGHYARY
jgi:hypothetical protein